MSNFVKGQKFVDASGVVVVEMASDIPGLTITPPGFKASDAQVMTALEMKQLAKLAKRDKNKPVGIVDSSPLQAQIDALKLDVASLQSQLDAIKVNLKLK